MPLNLIKNGRNDDNDEYIRQLNLLIKEYNNTNTNHSIYLLQQIDALSERLHQQFQSIPKTGDVSGDVMNLFLKWYLQKPVQLELESHFPDYFKLDKYLSHVNTKERVFIEASPEANSLILKTKNWQKMTTPVFGERSNYYKATDKLLTELQQAQDAHMALKESKLISDAGIKKVALGGVLHVLNEIQKSALLMLQEAPKDKPKIINNFNQLLAATNFLLKQTINSDDNLKYSYLTSECPPVSLLDATLHQGEPAIFALVKELFQTTDPKILHDYNIHYLGGVNNKNWRATNNETGDVCIIRIEKADDPNTDFFLVQEIKGDPVLSQYLAQDRFYYPTNDVVLDVDYERAFNIVVSEFCPLGDLGSYTRNQSNFSAHDEIKSIQMTNKILDASMQVARMAEDLIHSGKAYMDIKAGNFLLRDDGTLITADIKSIVRTNEKGQVPVNMISTTFVAPGHSNGYYDAQAFASYQIGLMMYDLFIADKQQLWIDRLRKKEPLAFTHPIFTSITGNEIKEIIQAALSENPERRPSLKTLITECKRLTMPLEQVHIDVSQYLEVMQS